MDSVWGMEQSEKMSIIQKRTSIISTEKSPLGKLAKRQAKFQSTTKGEGAR